MSRPAPGYVKNEMPWNEVRKHRPVDRMFGECGVTKWRQLDDKDNVGDIELVCRDGFTQVEETIKIPYFYREGVCAWLDGAMIQNCLSGLSETTRDKMLGIIG